MSLDVRKALTLAGIIFLIGLGVFVFEVCRRNSIKLTREDAELKVAEILEASSLGKDIETSLGTAGFSQAPRMFSEHERFWEASGATLSNFTDFSETDLQRTHSFLCFSRELRAEGFPPSRAFYFGTILLDANDRVIGYRSRSSREGL